MEENPYKAPEKTLSRPEPKGCLVVSFVTISAALATLSAINATFISLAAFLRHHSTGFIIERFTVNIVGTLLFATASWAGWKRRWRLAVAALAAGFLVPTFIVWMWFTVSH